MEWQIIVALVVMVPVVLLPIGIIWYLNIGRIKSSRAVCDDCEKRSE